MTTGLEAELGRITEAREGGIPWRKWGPYLSERQWGTVREDYSADGDAWTTRSFTFPVAGGVRSSARRSGPIVATGPIASAV